METKTRLDINAITSKIGDLPAVPEVVAEVIVLTDNPDSELSDVAIAIEKDPALAAKVLKVANSPYYGMRQVVGSLRLALVVLGIREVRNVVLGIGVLDTLRLDRTKVLLDPTNFWDHSFKTGGFARRLTTHFDLAVHGEEFVAGLLHDVGKLVLWSQLGDEYETVYRASMPASKILQDMERDAFGFDHADVGAALAKCWNMPETLVDAIAYHHDRGDLTLSDATDSQLAALVRIADLAMNEEQIDPKEVLEEVCADDMVWALAVPGEEIPVEHREVAILNAQHEICDLLTLQL